MPWKVFFCRPSGRSEIHITIHSKGATCPKVAGDYCRAAVRLWAGPDAEEKIHWHRPADLDERWPTSCEACGQAFGTDAERGMRGSRIFVRADTGDEVTLGQAPIGACWDADWYHDWRTGPDGRSLVVKTPGGDWFIDSEASNCTKKGDENHRCWIRHGKPEDGTLHVDKNGVTCSAGAGSIHCGKYHGFLRQGHLTDHC